MIRFAHFLGWWGVAILVFVAAWTVLCGLAKRRGDRERDRRDCRELRRSAEKHVAQKERNNGEN